MCVYLAQYQCTFIIEKATWCLWIKNRPVATGMQAGTWSTSGDLTRARGSERPKIPDDPRIVTDDASQCIQIDASRCSR